MERDPDIASLAARLGMRRWTYKSFNRPPISPMPPRVTDAPAPPLPAVESQPTPPLAIPAPHAPAVSLPLPPVIPAAAVQFPLLMQAFARSASPQPQAAPVAGAQPFLNLRRVVANASGETEN